MLKVKIEGSSMEPLIKNGDTLLFNESKAPKRGDIVLIRDNCELVVHRYVGKNLIKGDNSKCFDGCSNDTITILGTGEPIYRSSLLALLSIFNTKKSIIAKPSRALMIIVGTLLRTFRFKKVSFKP